MRASVMSHLWYQTWLLSSNSRSHNRGKVQIPKLSSDLHREAKWQAYPNWKIHHRCAHNIFFKRQIVWLYSRKKYLTHSGIKVPRKLKTGRLLGSRPIWALMGPCLKRYHPQSNTKSLIIFYLEEALQIQHHQIQG